jgi:16S rRNA G966 N2-methylase RsmD
MNFKKKKVKTSSFSNLNHEDQNKIIEYTSQFIPLYTLEKKNIYPLFENLCKPQKYHIYIQPDIQTNQNKNTFKNTLLNQHLPNSFISFIQNHIKKPNSHMKEQLEQYFFPVVQSSFVGYKIYIDDVDIEKNDKQIMILTDYFQLKERMNCTLKNQLSPYQFYQKNKKKLLNEYFMYQKKLHKDEHIPFHPISFSHFLHKINKKTFQQKDMNTMIHPLVFHYLMMKYKSKFCTLYKSYLMKLWIQIFDAKHILDLSAGWGDRLLGTLSLQNQIESYTGIDPNEKLFEGYHQMIDMLSLYKNRSKFEMICAGSETVDFQSLHKEFDLVFWSPPFFDLEIYVSNEQRKNTKHQSISKFKNYQTWEDSFLLSTIQHVIPTMKQYGIFIIYIGQVKPSFMIKLNKMNGIRNLGNLFVRSFQFQKFKSYIFLQKL